MDNTTKPCELCASDGGIILWQSAECRVVRVLDPDYPGFCRVIWTAHCREMTDLDCRQRQFLMDVVFSVEQVIRALFTPDKINLASFGNMTPHLHWHVIPRWENDRHFPEPIWGRIHHPSPPPRADVSDTLLRSRLKLLLPPDEASHA